MKKDVLVCCDNYFKKPKNGKCNGKYCRTCLEKHYDLAIEQLKDLPEWICFSCRDVCSCASCRRERGEEVPLKSRKRKSTSSFNTPTKSETSFSGSFCQEQERLLLPPMVLQADGFDGRRRSAGSLEAHFQQIPLYPWQHTLPMTPSSMEPTVHNIVGHLQEEMEKKQAELTEIKETEPNQCHNCLPLLKELQEEILEVTREVNGLKNRLKERQEWNSKESSRLQIGIQPNQW